MKRKEKMRNKQKNTLEQWLDMKRETGKQKK
jgi:hypothetical protein